ncbi:uncharacterized protein MELLADRAFT_69994 [Melampsora larici-populina 98AG31]|uniref:Uncharacterized protein n=1 Tax=Melampsora larici-populina (strain 98AG31 / pathotype 3-4-7) TaxID=747676 RepID=F4SD36_MELLP|nr:uncharacterized protein MELLADRAFT_69994 [Melampsora larici-populina 98AG31]EGF97442.1 hypothetical protein MELLADRAFT_69994 [Melampsora larici-populina 98AG31]
MSSTEADTNQQRKKNTSKAQSRKPSKSTERGATNEETENTNETVTSKLLDPKSTNTESSQGTTINKDSSAANESENDLTKEAELTNTTESLKNTSLALPNSEVTPSSTESTIITKKHLPKNYIIPKITVKKTINLGSDDSEEDEDKMASSFECTDLIANKPSLGPDWYQSVKKALLNGDSKAVLDLVKEDDDILQEKPNLKPSGSFVKKLDDQHCWLTAFRYDMAVRQIVVGHHVDGCPQDPSLPRPEQVEIAKNQTETLRDGFEMRHGIPYAKGQKWEKKSPITGKWYVGEQSHDNPNADEDVEEDNNSKGKKRANKWRNKENHHDYNAREDIRENHDHFKRNRGNRGNSYWGRRSRSPYQKEDQDFSSNDKGKGQGHVTAGNRDKE